MGMTDDTRIQEPMRLLGAMGEAKVHLQRLGRLGPCNPEMARAAALTACVRGMAVALISLEEALSPLKVDAIRHREAMNHLRAITAIVESTFLNRSVTGQGETGLAGEGAGEVEDA